MKLISVEEFKVENSDLVKQWSEMTKEQLLVYIWSIYPEGGAKDFWVVLLILYLAFIIVIYFAYLLDSAEEGSDEEREDKDDKKEEK